MQITQLPDDGAKYACSWGDWCTTPAERAVDLESAEQFNAMMREFRRIYPNTLLPSSVMRAMCDKHILIFEREFDNVERRLEDKRIVKNSKR